jgi:hypothetical protein
VRRLSNGRPIKLRAASLVAEWSIVLPDAAGLLKYCILALPPPFCAGVYLARLECFDRLLKRAIQKGRPALLWVRGKIVIVGVDDEKPIFDARGLHLTHDINRRAVSTVPIGAYISILLELACGLEMCMPSHMGLPAI